MEARDYYRKLNNDNLIPKIEGEKCWTPDEMILFAAMYHEMKMAEVNGASISHEQALNLADVSNNEVAVCNCAIPTRDADNECCTICGKLLYNE